MQGKHAYPNGARGAALSWEASMPTIPLSQVVALGPSLERILPGVSPE